MAPITSSLASLRSVPLASSSRLISTSIPRLAISTANRPKRDATEYGIPTSRRRSEWPDRASTDTTNHPLWKFFGAKKESLEVPDKREDTSSRSWTAPELRQREFKELHQLWYVLLKERNILLSQREEARRLRLDLGGFSSHADRLRMLQKSMARVKQIIAERRKAATDAIQILRARGEDEKAALLEQSQMMADMGESVIVDDEGKIVTQ